MSWCRIVDVNVRPRVLSLGKEYFVYARAVVYPACRGGETVLWTVRVVVPGKVDKILFHRSETAWSGQTDFVLTSGWVRFPNLNLSPGKYRAKIIVQFAIYR